MLHEITTCEVCESASLVSVLNLGEQPLPDDMTVMAQKYPTEIMFCDRCNTAHQRFQLPNEVVFKPDYHYRAGMTKDVLDGMEQLVTSVQRYVGGSLAGKRVLDIGCNDGSLLDVFKTRGAVTMGITPEDAGREAAAKGHAIDQGYFGPRAAHLYVKTYGAPDIITFTNVFAHIENLPQMCGCLRQISGPDTLIVIENHYLGSVFANNQFDTFYHEHPRTYSLQSFHFIADMLYMHVEHVAFPARYGGNIRVFLKSGRVSAPKDFGVNETNFLARFTQLSANVERWKKHKGNLLHNIYVVDGSFAAVAFPARASVLINLLRLNNKVSAVYEKHGSGKIGHQIPGTTIPVKSERDFLLSNMGDLAPPLINLAWHIPAEIHARWRENGFNGRIIDIVEPGDFL